MDARHHARLQRRAGVPTTLTGVLLALATVAGCSSLGLTDEGGAPVISVGARASSGDESLPSDGVSTSGATPPSSLEASSSSVASLPVPAASPSPSPSPSPAPAPPTTTAVTTPAAPPQTTTAFQRFSSLVVPLPDGTTVQLANGRGDSTFGMVEVVDAEDLNVDGDVALETVIVLRTDTTGMYLVLDHTARPFGPALAGPFADALVVVGGQLFAVVELVVELPTGMKDIAGFQPVTVERGVPIVLPVRMLQPRDVLPSPEELAATYSIGLVRWRSPSVDVVDPLPGGLTVWDRREAAIDLATAAMRSL
jgi:hypothetical protein